MAKIVAIGDPHFGIAPNNSLKFDVMLSSQVSFFENKLVPYMKEHGITDLICTGDLCDQRRRADVKVIQSLERLFEVTFAGIKCYVVQGNHDTYYKDDLSVTSLSIIWSKPNVTAITNIKPLNIHGKKFLFVPWLTTELKEKFIGNIDKISMKYDYLVGHFETIGFPFEGGRISTDGIDAEILYRNFKRTISGHFHTHSLKKAGDSFINYIGTPYQTTFGDAGEVKGFWVIDTDTDEMEFIENDVSAKFLKIKTRNELESYNDLTNCFVEFEYHEKLTHEEIFIIEKESFAKNPISFRMFPASIASISEIIPLEDHAAIELFDEMSVAINSEDMMSMAKVYETAVPYDDSDTLFEVLSELRAKVSG